MAVKALAATRAAGLKPDMVYLPRPSASPAQIAEAIQKGAAAPLYTGDPAPMGLADYGLSAGGDVYVANINSYNVSVINPATNQVLANIWVGSEPDGVAYDPANGDVYVTVQTNGYVSVIAEATNKVIAQVPVGYTATGVGYDPANGEVYSTNGASDNVSVIDGATNRVVASIPVGTEPNRVAFDAANGDLYVDNLQSNNVSVIDGATNQVVANVPVGDFPTDVAYDARNGDVYVTNANSNDASVIDGTSNEVVASVPVGSYPVGIGYDAGNGNLYVANADSNDVSVVDGATNEVVATIPVGHAPESAGYDAENGDVYVANGNSNNVSVINGMTDRVTATVPVGLGPVDLAYAGATGAGVPTPSVLNTTALQGYVDASSTGIQGQDLYQALPDGFSIQMNAVLTNVTLFSNYGYQFWAQDIVTYFPASGYMILVTNVWNFSAPLANMTNDTIYSHGPYGHDDYASLGYYYANYTVPYRVSYPFDVTLTMTSSVWNEAYDNVSFSASVNSPTGAFRNVSMDNYDYVVFNSSDFAGLPQPSNFTASGLGYNHVDLLDDFEIVVCGPGGGSQVDLSTADATLGLAYWTDAEHSAWAAIPSAFNYGADTAETSTGANVAWGNSSNAGPNGIAPYAIMTTGPAILSGLWGNGAPEGSSTFFLSVSPGNAFNFFLYQGAPNFSTGFVSQYEFAPSTELACYYDRCGGEFHLMPGSYLLESELSEYSQVIYNFTIPEMFSVNLTLDPDASLGVYTPLWAFSNAEVAAIAQSGAGTPQNPYILFNNQPAPLSSDFGLYNDFDFPVFPGVFLKDTNVSVELNNSSSFVTYTNSFQPWPAQVLPTTNDLQFWFWNVSNVALVNDSNISGWFGLQTYYPLTYNSFNVVFYASEHNLVANNWFFTQSQALLMYANGTSYGPPRSTGGNNTIWGNGMIQITPPLGCPGPGNCSALLPYDSGLGLEIGEGYDLIYNNLVETPTTAWLLPLNLYTEEPFQWTHDAWNIANQSANTIHYAPGFPTFSLNGSVVGGPNQGGNSWWDYGVTQNFANGADNPIGVLPYDENASTLIDPLPGFGTAIPGYPCPQYYCASYIYSGGDYVPLNSSAATATVAPHGLQTKAQWGAVISCQPAKRGGGGPAKRGGGGPAKRGGGGPCSTIVGADPPPIVIAVFETNASSVEIVLPDGVYNWTPIVPNGYTSSVGGSFVVTATTPVALNVPYAPPTQAVLTFAEQGLPSGLPWQVTVGGTPMGLTTDGATDSVSFLETLGDSYPYTISTVPGWRESTLPLTGNVAVTTAPTTEPTLAYTQVSYPVTISESGLPAGQTWAVTFNAVQKSITTDGATDTLGFASEPNGTYGYSLQANPGYLEKTIPYSGTETVNGVPLTVSVSYGPFLYAVSFSESGLPSGATWKVTFNSVPLSLTTDGKTDTLVFAPAPNGSYSYSIAPNPGFHESTIPYSGTESVHGAPLAVSVTYFQVAFPVTFSESGLPAGLPWKVTFNGTALSLTTNAGTGTLAFGLFPNGTYSYSIAGNGGYHEYTIAYSGTLSVNGAPLVENLKYVPMTYSVTFSESGLPSGLTWKVTFNGNPLSLTTNGKTDTLTFSPVLNGTYSYTIAPNPGYHESTIPYSGSRTVNSAPLAISVTYTAVTYSVTFWETGLPSGLTWSVTVNGVAKTVTTNGILNWLTWTGVANGTYAYSITDNPAWHQYLIPYNGKLVVNGGSVNVVLVYFPVTYSVTFSESGLPAGLTWTVTLNGVTQHLKTNGGTDSLTWTGLTNGTYTYSITAVSGWHQSTLPTTGSVVVKGASVTEPTLKYTH